MKHKTPYLRKLQNNTEAGIATYILIMLGMAFILYMFGFTSMYSQWSGDSNINNGTQQSNISITEETLNKGGFIEQIMNPINLLSIGAAGLVGIGIIAWFMGKGSTVIWQYAIPAMILVALNIFVFPLSDITAHTNQFTVNGVPVIAAFLIAFFNVFYILAFVDFIRGTT